MLLATPSTVRGTLMICIKWTVYIVSSQSIYIYTLSVQCCFFPVLVCLSVLPWGNWMCLRTANAKMCCCFCESCQSTFLCNVFTRTSAGLKKKIKNKTKQKRMDVSICVPRRAEYTDIFDWKKGLTEINWHILSTLCWSNLWLHH